MARRSVRRSNAGSRTGLMARSPAAACGGVTDDIGDCEHLCNAADGTSGVTSDAGQSEDVFVRGGKFACVTLDDLPGAFLQVAHARVVAEAFPEFQQLLFGCVSE